MESESRIPPHHLVPLGKQMAAVRKIRGFTRRSAALYADISLNLVKKIEYDPFSVKKFVLDKYMQAMGITFVAIGVPQPSYITHDKMDVSMVYGINEDNAIDKKPDIDFSLIKDE